MRQNIGQALNRRAALAALAGAALGPIPSRAAERKPNIVIFLADDLGHGDLGVTGCPDIQTPHIDRLAAEGVRFTHAYANAPVCSPTRAALLTGRYQQRSGIDRVIYADERDQGMALDAMLLPELLEAHGYASALIGKWHLGYPKKFFPTRQGFDNFVGFVSGNIDYFSHTDRLENHDLWRGEESLEDPRYMTELIAGEAIRFVDRNRKKPFLLYCPFNAPHDPFQGPEHRATAGDQKVTRQVNRTRAVYKSMVESLDHQIGRIVKHIDESGLGDNTVFFFMSDNGGLPVVARNAPFSGFKTELCEGGIRTPLIARWKGKFPAGRTVGDMAIGMDLFPTTLEIAGVAPPDGLKLDGVSLLDACHGTGRLSRDTLYFHYHGPGQQPQYAMVQRGWKYLSGKQGREFLFNLKSDTAEQTDLSAREPERFRSMKSEYNRWKSGVFEGTTQQPKRQN